MQGQRIANWILSFPEEGIRPYSDPPGRKRGERSTTSRRRSSKKTTSGLTRKVRHRQSTSEAGSHIDKDCQDHRSLLDDEEDTDEASVVSSTAFGALATTDDQDTCENIPEIAAQASKELITTTYGEMTRDQKIMTIKERLKLFDWVYGEGKPQRDLKNWEEKLDYMSSVAKHPRSVPKGGSRTQGYSRLQIVTLPEDDPALHNHVIPPDNYAHLDKRVRNHGLNFNQSIPHAREVLTEDSTFGITRYPKDETETPEGLQAYNNARCVKHRSRQEMANDHSKPKEDIRMEEAEAAEADSERARKDLGIKRWD